MPFSAVVVKVMIAGPSDVAAEKKAARDVIEKWNISHAEHNELILYPVQWETHSTPQYGKHPQEVINSDVLRGSDFLIAIFGTKLGSSTEKFSSGTVEEIETHHAAGKDALVYFSNKRIPRDHDPKQLQKLNEFRESCKPKSLYAQFSTTANFREDLTRHLTQLVQRWQRESSQPAVQLKNPFESDADTDFVDDGFSDQAAELLRGAKLNNGILVLLSVGGESDNLFAGERDFYSGGGESMANYESALEDLISNGYFKLEPDGPAVTRIRLTKHGWQAAKKV